jgi:hypothetical protein
MTQLIKARPTLYKGIQMRSRLEADYAAYLDRSEIAWEYEPVCFAGPDAQWLPDFRIEHGGYPIYIEVKPTSLPEDQVDTVLNRMAVTWLTDPEAIVELDLWPFGDSSGCVRITGDLTASPTWWQWAADGTRSPWPGMGQLDRMLIEQLDRMTSGGEA